MKYILAIVFLLGYIYSLIRGKGLIKGINSTFVVYDGNPLIQKDVHSLFKYYKK